ncbi:MAG: hypothetical protein AB2A00_11680 [Myxococcota bacterium]
MLASLAVLLLLSGTPVADLDEGYPPEPVPVDVREHEGEPIPDAVKRALLASAVGTAAAVALGVVGTGVGLVVVYALALGRLGAQVGFPPLPDVDWGAAGRDTGLWLWLLLLYTVPMRMALAAVLDAAGFALMSGWVVRHSRPGMAAVVLATTAMVVPTVTLLMLGQVLMGRWWRAAPMRSLTSPEVLPWALGLGLAGVGVLLLRPVTTLLLTAAGAWVELPVPDENS